MTQFSIIITTYNRLELLKRAIDSALNQTVKSEIVVIDDYSDDGTQEYLLSLENRIKYHRNNRNLGHAYCVNKGVKISQGEWIKLLDDDDYLQHNCIETFKIVIKKNTSAVICSCQVINVNKQQQKIKVTRKVGEGKNCFIKQENIHYLMLLDKLPFGTPVQVAFRKQQFDYSGGWNSDFDYCCDDIDSWLKISQFGDAIFINQPLAYRTIWKEGYNQKYSLEHRLNANILIKNKIYELVSAKHKSELPPLSDIHQYLNLYWALIALGKMNFKIFIKLFLPVCFHFNSWKILLSRIKIEHLQ